MKIGRWGQIRAVLKHFKFLSKVVERDRIWMFLFETRNHCLCIRLPNPFLQFCGCQWTRLGIPVKVNIDSGGSRTAFRSEGEQQSERSDAGMVIVE